MVLESEEKDKPHSLGDFFSEHDVVRRIKNYGFVEVSDILRFLTLVCDNRLNDYDYLYIRAKVGHCLKMHDNGSDYFISLRELAAELDCLIFYH